MQTILTSCGTSLWRTVLLLTLLLPASNAWSTGTEPVTDLRILVDISGSMRQNDPGNLRAPALRLLIGLIPDNARSGIWTFGQYVNMQVKHGTVDQAWKELARREAGNIHNRGLFTNIEEAIRRSSFDWDQPDERYDRHMILLTDGMVDISRDEAKNESSRNNILQRLLPQLKKNGVKIHTVALSNKADHNLLKNLSLATSGWYEQVDSTEQLHKTFLRIFERSTPVETVPIYNNSFQVDENITDMTLLLFHKDSGSMVGITTPDGQKWDHDNYPAQAKWYREDAYTMITIDRPQHGTWKMEANVDPDNRVIVTTNVHMRTSKLPSGILAAETTAVHAYLMTDNEIINNRELLDLTSFRIMESSRDDRDLPSKEMLDDGEAPDDRERDGIYSATLSATENQNILNISIEARNNTFSRQYQQAIKVYPDIAEVSSTRESNGQHRIRLLIMPELVYLNSISAQLETPEGDHLALSRMSDVEWNADIPASERERKLIITISGIRNNGKAFESSKELLLTADGSLPETEPQDSTPPEGQAEHVTALPPAPQETIVAAETAPDEAQPTEAITPPEPAPNATEEPDREARVAETAVPRMEGPETVKGAKTGHADQEQTSWWLVFAIVLGINAVLAALGGYGYYAWKKRKNRIDLDLGTEERHEQSTKIRDTQASQDASQSPPAADKSSEPLIPEVDELHPAADEGITDELDDDLQTLIQEPAAEATNDVISRQLEDQLNTLGDEIDPHVEEDNPAVEPQPNEGEQLIPNDSADNGQKGEAEAAPDAVSLPDSTRELSPDELLANEWAASLEANGAETATASEDNETGVSASEVEDGDSIQENTAVKDNRDTGNATGDESEPVTQPQDTELTDVAEQLERELGTLDDEMKNMEVAPEKQADEEAQAPLIKDKVSPARDKS